MALKFGSATQKGILVRLESTAGPHGVYCAQTEMCSLVKTPSALAYAVCKRSLQVSQAWQLLVP